MGKGKHLFNSLQGDGHYRIDIGLEKPEDFATTVGVDFSDHAAVKKLLLQDDYFGSYEKQFRDMIQHSEGPFRPWLMYYMPPDRLNWSKTDGVALIGDAAHVTVPYVGEGVNCAMRDSCVLVEKLREFGITDKAISEYNKEILPYAADVIRRSVASGMHFFEDEAPKTFLQVMTSANPLIGASERNSD
jgi:2-polyprenyl-6-methoxyphenol hydroxylase-like FAD-dependent oxidoreductase